MVKPDTLKPRPSHILALLGGVVATLLLSALIYLAPVIGFPFVDFPRLVGGIFTGDSQGAFWLGYWIFFLTGVFLFAPLIANVWTGLPGHDLTYPGALVKGVLWGLLLWILSGLLLPLFGVLNQAPGLENPGFFALALGWPAAAGMLLGHLAYGISLAMITSAGQGFHPLDLLGWEGYGTGATRAVALETDGRKAHGAPGT